MNTSWLFFNKQDNNLYFVYKNINNHITTIKYIPSINNNLSYVIINNNIPKYYKFINSWELQNEYNIYAISWNFTMNNTKDNITNIELYLYQIANGQIISNILINNLNIDNLFFNNSMYEVHKFSQNNFNNLTNFYYTTTIINKWIDYEGYLYYKDNNIWIKNSEIIDGTFIDTLNNNIIHIENKILITSPIIDEFKKEFIINNIDYLIFIDSTNLQIIQYNYDITDITNIIFKNITINSLENNQIFINMYNDSSLLLTYTNNKIIYKNILNGDTYLNIKTGHVLNYINNIFILSDNLDLFSLNYILNDTIYVYDGLSLYKYTDINGDFVENDGFYFANNQQFLIYNIYNTSNNFVFVKSPTGFSQNILLYNTERFLSNIINNVFVLFSQDSNIKLINGIQNMSKTNISIYQTKTNLEYLNYLFNNFTLCDIDPTSYFYKNILLQNSKINNSVTSNEDFNILINELNISLNNELITNLIININVFKTLINVIYNTDSTKSFKFVYVFNNEFNNLSDLLETENSTDNITNNLKISNEITYNFKIR